jgi:hypothetical protein
MLEQFIGQLLALIAFFAFPVIQYVLLKRFSGNAGQPRLWYLPQFGFRLVIRNIRVGKTFSDIKYRALLRNTISPSPGSSVATLDDRILLQREDFFLFPNVDQLLLCFRIEGKSRDKLTLVVTDKHGRPLDGDHNRMLLDHFNFLIADYSANLENIFNFDVKLMKRCEISVNSLRESWESIQRDNSERPFDIIHVREVG